MYQTYTHTSLHISPHPHLEQQREAHLEGMRGQKILLAADHEGARGQIFPRGGHLGHLLVFGVWVYFSTCVSVDICMGVWGGMFLEVAALDTCGWWWLG